MNLQKRLSTDTAGCPALIRRLNETPGAFSSKNSRHNKDIDIMSLPLATYYHRLHYEVMESDGGSVARIQTGDGARARQRSLE